MRRKLMAWAIPHRWATVAVQQAPKRRLGISSIFLTALLFGFSLIVSLRPDPAQGQAFPQFVYWVYDAGTADSQFGYYNGTVSETLGSVYMDADIEGIACLADQLYGASGLDGAAPSQLYRVNVDQALNTAELVPVGPIELAGGVSLYEISSLAAKDGFLWGFASLATGGAPTGIIRIDPATGQAELVQASNLDVAAVAWIEDELWMTANRNFYSWTPGGAITLRYTIPAGQGMQIEALDAFFDDALDRWLLYFAGDGVVDTSVLDPTTGELLTGLSFPVPDDVESFTFCVAPGQLLSLGNRVWRDVGNGNPTDPNFDNALFDAGESPIAGVALELLDATGAPVDSDPVTGGIQPYVATTDANGYYTFTNLLEGGYQVRVLASNFAAGGPLAGMISSTDIASSADPNNDVDNDDNGIGAGSGVVTSGVITLTLGAEPTGEIHLGVADADVNTNFTVDFGFWQAAPTIVLKKYTNGEDADTITGPEVGYGDVVTWTYDITNTGSITLADVTLVDDIEGGVTCPLTQLAPGQTMTCVLTGLATTMGQYTNTAVVTGTPTLFPTQRVTDTDPSHYLTRPFSLGNRVWRDDGTGGGTTNDGVQNGGEPGIGGVVLNLLTASGTPVFGPNNQPLTTTTAADGCYLFDGLRRGDYIVEIAAGNFAPGGPLAGLVSSTGNSSNGQAPDPDNDLDLDDNGNDAALDQAVRSGVVTLSLNSEPLAEAACGAGSGGALDQNSNLTVDFGFVPPLPVSVGDRVWFDTDSDGVQDNGEVGVPGVTVSIFTADGQPATDINGAAVPTQTTDVDGLYLFTNLAPGSYYVVFDTATLPPGTGVTTPNVGTDDAVDSDANPSTGQTAPTPFLPGGAQDLTLDMGVVELVNVRIGDYVWIDRNLNGQQDNGEPGVPGVTVTLFDATNDQQLGVTQTDGSGIYLFDNLPPGQYYVVFDLSTLPAGYRVTTQNATGVSDTLDSDADPTTGRTGNSQILTGGQEDLSLDMGIFALLSLGNLVWLDESATGTNNGVVDPGEPGLEGIPVRLLSITGTLIATTTTDVNGSYLFTDLLPGEYIVEILVPDGYSSSSGGREGDPVSPYEPGPDPDNDIDNDDNGTAQTNPLVIRSAPVTLSIGDEPDPTDPNYNPTVDFGVCEGCGTSTAGLAIIGDYVWEDANCDGIQEPGAGVPNVTVRLYSAAGELIATTTTNAQGIYLFGNLEPGQYFIEFVRPVGYEQFSPTQAGPDIELDSDANATTGRAPTTVLVSDETDRSWDAGLCLPTAIEPGEEPGQNRLFLPLISE
jgi:hypothetical protein